MRFFSPGWCSSRSGLHNVTPHNHTQPSGLFQGELIYTYRTKVAPGQVSTSWRAYAVSAISALSCYITVQSHCLQIMGPENIRSWGERASWEPLVEFPTAAMGIDLKRSHLSLSLSHTHTHTLYEVMDVITKHCGNHFATIMYISLSLKSSRCIP